MAGFAGSESESSGKGDFLEKFALLLESDRFRKAVEEIKTTKVVEVPDYQNVPVPVATFYDVPTPRAVFEDEIIKRPVYKDDPVKVQSVHVEEVTKTVEVPKYVPKVYELPEIHWVPENKVYEVPDVQFVKTEALTESMQGILLKALVEALKGALPEAMAAIRPAMQEALIMELNTALATAIPEAIRLTPIEKKYDLDVPNIVSRDVFSDKVRWIEKDVELLRPHYKCQACGHEI
jgi:hypothetical protein